jgi:DNA (cytosine-5)-methyltransferase 1
MNELLTHGGLFEGIGGFSLAAERQGIATTWACELNPFKRKLLRQHFKNANIYFDITKLSYPSPVDILTGGFPCTNISAAGNGDGIFGADSFLWCEYYRIICECKPRYIIIENSPFLTKRGLEYILYDIARAGYNAQWKCLQGNQFGYRHKRKRMFIVAYPMQKRFNTLPVLFAESSEFNKERAPKQAQLSMLLKRYDKHSDFTDIRGNNGFPKGLDENRIRAIGDAVIPDIAEYVIWCIKKFNQQLIQ